MFNHHIQYLKGYTPIPAGCADVVRPDGRNGIYLARLPNGDVILTDDQDHIEMQVMPGVKGASRRAETVHAIASALGLGVSSSGALVAICHADDVDDTLSRFQMARKQIARLDFLVAA